MAEDMEVKADLEEVKSEVVTADMDLDVKVESVESLSKPDLLGVTDLGQVKASLIGTFATVCDRFGGPSQFLLDRFPSEKSQGKFRQQLLQAFPLQSCVNYVVPSLLGKKESTMLHVSMLGFTPETSTKPFPYSSVCKQLFEEYLAHGFLTDVEPLRVWCTAEEKQNPLKSLRCGLSKVVLEAALCWRCSVWLWMLGWTFPSCCRISPKGLWQFMLALSAMWT